MNTKNRPEGLEVLNQFIDRSSSQSEGGLKSIVISKPKPQNNEMSSTGGLSSVFGKPNKETSDELSKLAAEILSGSRVATQEDAKKLAGSVLSQDETKGRRRNK